MKRILVILGIVVGAVIIVLLFILGISFEVAPYETADFFLQLNSDRYFLWTKEGTFSVDVRRMEEGIESSDRIFLQRKRVAFETIVMGEDKFEKELGEYHLALRDAGKDGLLTVGEFDYLKQLHSDIVPEEYVHDWIELAKKYENVISEENRREKYKYLQH